MSHDTYPGRQDVQRTGEGIVPGSESNETAFQIPKQEVPPREGGYAQLPLETPTTTTKEREAKKKLRTRIAIAIGGILLASGLGTAIGLSQSESSGASGPVATSSAEAAPTTTTATSTTETMQTNPNIQINPQTVEMQIGAAECNGIDSCAKMFEVTAHDKPDYKDGFTHLVLDSIQAYEDPANGAIAFNKPVRNQAAEDAFEAAFSQAISAEGKQPEILAVARQNRQYNITHQTKSVYEVLQPGIAHLGELSDGLVDTATITHAFVNKDGEQLPGTLTQLKVTYGIQKPNNANKYDLTGWQATKIDS